VTAKLRLKKKIPLLGKRKVAAGRFTVSCPATDIGGPAAGCTAAAERLAPVHEAVDAFAAEIGLNKMQENAPGTIRRS
jgi:hypothetical protein